MWFLIAVVLLNGYLAIIFKLFPAFKIDALQAIVVNYLVCVITGTLFAGHFPIGSTSLQQAWLPFALVMGIFLITLFNLIAWSTKEAGITATTVANKLSLVIPAVFAVLWYGDYFDGWKIGGVILAIPAVYLSARSKDEQGKVKGKIMWPILLFAGSGVLDSLVAVVSRDFFSTGNTLEDNTQNANFLIHTFATAAILGCLYVSYLFITKRSKPHFRNLIAGVSSGSTQLFQHLLSCQAAEQ